MERITGVHVIRNSGYINGSVRGLTCDEKRDTCVCKINVKCNIANCLNFWDEVC